MPQSAVAVPSAAELAMSDATRGRLRAGVADNTRRAYGGAWSRFETWCAEHTRTALPSTAETLAEYVNHLAELGRARSTSQQAIAAIRKAHVAADVDAPDTGKALLVLRGATREQTARGERARQAPPITLNVLRAMVEQLDPSRTADVRDHALLLLGWSAFARRSEVASLHVSDVVETEHGLELWVRHAKTDKIGEGQAADLIRGSRPDTDPVTVLRRWLAVLAAHGITDGSLLRTVDRHGRIGGAMSGDAISDAVRRLAVRAGVPRAEEYSGHSLRAGAATAAFEAGAPIATVCRAGRWADGSQAVGRYFRSVDRWRDHPLRGIGL